MDFYLGEEGYIKMGLFLGVKIYEFFGLKKNWKKFSKKFPNFFLSKINTEYSKWHFLAILLQNTS